MMITLSEEQHTMHAESLSGFVENGPNGQQLPALHKKAIP